MKKTLILCFIHGFKGGESTFGNDYQFASDLRALVARELPKINVKVLVYPKYETRGNLAEAVTRFRDWLQDKIIDLEVEAGTPSPTVEPSIRAILVGHSMGGIVAAETVAALTSDKPIPPAEAEADDKDGHEDETKQEGPDSIQNDTKTTTVAKTTTSLNALMFPYIQGVLALDTPYLGIAPGAVAHRAEDQYKAITQATAQLGTLAGLWGGGGGGTSNNNNSSSSNPKTNTSTHQILPPPTTVTTVTTSTKASAPPPAASGWGKFGKIAAFAGASAALAGAAGAAAYLGREQIAGAADWVGSHIQFVGCLANTGEMRGRLRFMALVGRELDVGFGNLYTRLGKGVVEGDGNGGSGSGSERTFCNLPEMGTGMSTVWKEEINDFAVDEAGAHMSMFEPARNPGYNKLANDAKDLVVGWTRNAWYESSGEE